MNNNLEELNYKWHIINNCLDILVKLENMRTLDDSLMNEAINQINELISYKTNVSEKIIGAKEIHERMQKSGTY